MRTYWLAAIVSGLVLSLAFGTPADESDARSVQSGVFSDAQVKRGEKLFNETCIACHQPEEFAAAGYMDGWVGLTAHDLFEVIRTTMPEDNPGRLKRQEYADIIAFLFQLNGAPAGEQEMDVKSLKEIQIEGPFGRSND